MKSFWLIVGGISLGRGITLALDSDKKNDSLGNNPYFAIIGGALVICGGLFLLDK